MATVARSTTIGLFRSLAEAERAVDALRRAGLRDEQLALILRSGGHPAGHVAVTAKPVDARQYVAVVEALETSEVEAAAAGWLVDAG